MDIIKIGGLAMGGTAKMLGIPFIGEFSMLIEELGKSFNEMKESINRVETMVTAQVLGNGEAGKIALQNAFYDAFSLDEKIEEVNRARALFEKCYADLSGVPHLLKHRGKWHFGWQFVIYRQIKKNLPQIGFARHWLISMIFSKCQLLKPQKRRMPLPQFYMFQQKLQVPLAA